MAKAVKLFLGETNLFGSRRGVRAYDLLLVVHNGEREKYGELTKNTLLYCYRRALRGPVMLFHVGERESTTSQYCMAGKREEQAESTLDYG